MNKKIKSLVLILAVTVGLGVCAQQMPVSKQLVSVSNTQQSYVSVNPLDLVARPNFYLNKNVKIKAKFDRFTTLGLDYPPAMRSSDKFLSFLIQRPDITDHNIPLSELKIFIVRTEVEKYIDLNSGDEVEFSGKVFSSALGEPWMQVDNFKVLSTKTKEKK